MAVRYITRGQWGARPARYVSHLPNPAGLTAHWEGPRMGYFPHSSCAAKVRGIQNFHMDGRGWSDIAYNALVCPHGYTFEGRGVGRKAGASGTAGNNASWAICWLSGSGDPYTAAGRNQMRDAFAWFRSKGAGRAVWAHRDWMSTACPGNAIYADTNNGWLATGTAIARPAPACSKPGIKRGMSGFVVVGLQQLLNASGKTLAVDGDFGPRTERAVREFNSFFKLESGACVNVATKKTLDMLEYIKAIKEGGGPTTKPRVKKPVPRDRQIVVQKGDRNYLVGGLQHALNHVAGQTLSVDGIFGDRTRRAVVQFQNWAKRNGNFKGRTDGKVDGYTWKLLDYFHALKH